MSLLNGGHRHWLSSVEQAAPGRHPMREPRPAHFLNGKAHIIRRCRLCGGPSLGLYCAGHSWAYGDPQA